MWILKEYKNTVDLSIFGVEAMLVDETGIVCVVISSIAVNLLVVCEAVAFGV